KIDPLIVIPSLFFISSESGVPLEVIAGAIDKKSLVDRLKKAKILAEEDVGKLEIENKAPDVKVTDNTKPDQLSESQAEEEQMESENIVDSTTTTEAVNNSIEESNSIKNPSERTTDNCSSAAAACETTPTIEERIERANELISQRQEIKANEELELEKQREVERRRQSHELAKARQKREEQERYEITKQRKKDKEEDRLARERVKAQIAADRAERQVRMSIIKGEEPFQPKEDPKAVAGNAIPPQNERNEVTRIKFRFPDNSSELAQFPPGATLRDVQKHLLEKCNLPFSKFKLVGTLPPRTFTENEMPQTLEKLDLSPSAIIIVKPLSGETSTSLAPLGQSVVMFLWSMFSPLIVIYEYLKGFLGFGERTATRTEPSSDEEESQAIKRPRTEGSYTTRNRPKTAYGMKDDRENPLKREGNIHRLNRDKDDDDENNTWNGNSTQQM
ncbi:UBX domain-containing protein 4, partial [Armadillidium vulgare]